MNKFLRGVGVAALVVVALIVVGIGVLTYDGVGANADCEKYARDTAVAVTTQWDMTALTDRAAPEFKKAADGPQLAAAFAWFKSLGPLVKMGDCTGGFQVFAFSTAKEQVISNYQCQGVYKNGNATITVKGLKRDGHWMVGYFGVNSPHLLPRA